MIIAQLILIEIILIKETNRSLKSTLL